MEEAPEFYPMKGYLLQERNIRSSAMENYLERITRLAHKREAIRVNALAENLHVKALCVTKMVQQLTQKGYLHDTLSIQVQHLLKKNLKDLSGSAITQTLSGAVVD